MSKLSPPVILVIDSNPLTMTATSAALNCKDYQVLCASDIHGAVEVCLRSNLDLIICDVSIRSENDGYELIQNLRKVPELADIPVVYVSAGQLPDVISRSTITGTAYHLKKPFEPKSLFELIEKALWLPHLVHSHISQPKSPQKPHFPLTTDPNSVKTTSNTFTNN